MKRATYISTILRYPQLPEMQIRGTAGKLIHRLFIDEPIHISKIADITYESEFENLDKPEGDIIKLSKKKYVDDFFSKGSLQLGSFEYYSKYDNDEIGDKSEGSLIVVGNDHKFTTFAEISSGFNNYVFCCSQGEPDQEIMAKFGYDDYFIITDYEGFMNEITKVLEAKFAFNSQCLYKMHKVLVGKTPENFDFNVISAKLSEMVNHTKYFIKYSKFKHQKEYRFIWAVEEDIQGCTIIECPEAVKYCRRK